MPYRLSDGAQAAMKLAATSSAKHKVLQHEARVLLRLSDLWGKAVPALLAAGELPNGGYAFGTSVLEGRALRKGAERLLEAWHL